MFEDPELKTLTSVLDAGVRAVGIQLFTDNGGVLLQSAIDKLQANFAENSAKREVEAAKAPKTER